MDTTNAVIPLKISVAVGVYCTVAAVVLGTKAPPLPCQAWPVAFVTVLLAVITGLLAQTDAGATTETVGAGVKEIFMVEETALQVPFPVVVNFRVTEPAANSAALGL